MPAPDSVWRFFSTKKPDILSGFSGRRIQRELNFRIPAVRYVHAGILRFFRAVTTR
ncbi:MAG: hypothetical protein RLZZ537_1361, partial [Pseudomonadota bacterium]